MTQYSGKIIRKTPVVPSQTSASGVWTTADAAAAVKNNTWPVAGVPNPISRSVRVRNSASAYLNRTPASASNRRTWTYSGWVKRGLLTTRMSLLGGYTGTTNGTLRTDIDFQDGAALYIGSDQMQTATDFNIVTTQIFRDPSAWYHIVVAFDTTQSTSTDRVKVYVNGVQVTAFSTASYPSLNYQGGINFNSNQYINRWYDSVGGNYYGDGYMTEINFIDGQALTPSSFGTTDSTTGAWVPMPYTGTYGTNGFYLNFKDNTSTTTIGYDYSGNSNNWTANNISLTAGTTYDSMVDVPTLWMPYNTAGDVGATVRGNYCVLNRLVTTLAGASPPTISDGNLNISFGNAGYSVGGNMFVSSGQIYFEVSGTNAGGITNTISFNGFISDSGSYWGYQVYNGSISSNLGSSAYSGTGYGSGAWPVIGIAVDLSTGKIWWRNDSGWFGSGNPATGANPAFTNVSGNITPYWNGGGGGYSGSHYFNFGQRPFTYTPPSGFKSLNTFNLPAPTINNGASYMAATIYTGTGATASISNTVNGVGFQPDLVWFKVRNTTYSNTLLDALRNSGANALFTDLTSAESANYANGQITAFNTNGVTINSGVALNESTRPYVAWQWTGGNSTSTNTSGSITSTIRANPTSGFSIVTYTGTGANATVGHGLGVAPKMVIVKCRTGTSSDNWAVWHSSFAGGSSVIYLNLTNAVSNTATTMWNSTTPTSTVFSIGTADTNRASGYTYVAYCFAAVAGYSAFGSYTGNASTDGPFVYLGFRPRWVMMKRTDSADDWVVFDTSRNTYDVMNSTLFPNGSYSETTDSNRMIDTLSNGFKIRSSPVYINASGGTYIYAAFAENPFKYSNAR